MSGLVVGLIGLGAAASISVSGTYLLGGALGSLPGIIAGAAAAIATLQIGFMGISDAFKDVGGSGGELLAAQARQVAQATRGVESAQRSLARAQREVVEAQKAVTRAREEEVERLDDLNRSVKRARLDEEEAVLRVRDAERELEEARRTGLTEEIQRADLAYRQAVLGLEDAKDATADLTAEQAKSAKVGVEGSDQVQDALKRQRDAIEGVTAAQEQLLGPGGPAGGPGEACRRRRGAAQELIKRLLPLEGLRQQDQEPQACVRGSAPQRPAAPLAWGRRHRQGRHRLVPAAQEDPRVLRGHLQRPGQADPPTRCRRSRLSTTSLPVPSRPARR